MILIKSGKVYMLVSNLPETTCKFRRNWQICRAPRAEELEEREVKRYSINLIREKFPEVEITDEHLTTNQKQCVVTLLEEYSDVFANAQYIIPLTTEQAIKIPYRRIPPNQVPEVKEHIKKLCEHKSLFCCNCRGAQVL